MSINYNKIHQGALSYFLKRREDLHLFAQKENIQCIDTFQYGSMPLLSVVKFLKESIQNHHIQERVFSKLFVYNTDAYSTKFNFAKTDLDLTKLDLKLLKAKKDKALDEYTVNRARLNLLILSAHIELYGKPFSNLFEFDVGKPTLTESQFIERLKVKGGVCMTDSDIKFLIECIDGSSLEVNHANITKIMAKPVLLQKAKTSNISIVVLMWCLLSSILEVESDRLYQIEKVYTEGIQNKKEEIEEISSILKTFFGRDFDSVLISQIYTDYSVRKKDDTPNPLLFAQTCIDKLNEVLF